VKTVIVLLGFTVVAAMLVVMVSTDFFALFRGERTHVTQVYFADNISPAHQAAIQEFNTRYAGKIEVIPVNLPFDKFTTNERKELLTRSLRTKSDRIDIFAVDYIWVARFAKWAEPLDRHVTDGEKKAILNDALETCTYNNALVAMPFYIDIGMMYYRRDLVQKFPDSQHIEERLRRSISWEELLRLGSRFDRGARSFYIFQANDFEGLVCNYFEILAGMDPEFRVHRRIDLSSHHAHAALQFLVDLVHRQKLSPTAVSEFDEQRSYTYMLQHDGVFIRGWPNFLEQFRTFFPDTNKLNNIARSALPHFEGKRPASVFGGWNLMVSKYSTRKDAAIKFIRFLQTEEIQRLLFEIGGYIPINTSVYADSSYLSNHPDLRYYRTLLDNGFHRPVLEEYTKISDILSHYLHAAVKRELTVAEALQNASRMIESNEVLIK